MSPRPLIDILRKWIDIRTLWNRFGIGTTFIKLLCLEGPEDVDRSESERDFINFERGRVWEHTNGLETNNDISLEGLHDRGVQVGGLTFGKPKSSFLKGA